MWEIFFNWNRFNCCFCCRRLLTRMTTRIQSLLLVSIFNFQQFFFFTILRFVFVFLRSSFPHLCGYSLFIEMSNSLNIHFKLDGGSSSKIRAKKDNGIFHFMTYRSSLDLYKWKSIDSSRHRQRRPRVFEGQEPDYFYFFIFLFFISLPLTCKHWKIFLGDEVREIFILKYFFFLLLNENI